jgi:hypothetical protein
VEPRYASIGVGGNGLFPAQSDGKWGYIGAKGESVIESRFEEASSFENGVAAVKLNGRWGYLRADGSMEIPPTLVELGGREGIYISARDDVGWALFKLLQRGLPKRNPPKRTPSEDDTRPPGIAEFPRDTQRAYSISEGSIVAKFADGEQMFFINTNSIDRRESDEFHLMQFFFFPPYKLISILRMSEGFAAAAIAANKWGYLHKASGEFLWPGRFEAALEFKQGLAPVKLAGKWGYIDLTGHMAIEPTYDAAFPFRGEYAIVRQGEKRGFLRLNPEGGISLFIAPQYEDAFRFAEGLAPVKMGGRWGYVSNGQLWTELRDTGTVDIHPQ